MTEDVQSPATLQKFITWSLPKEGGRGEERERRREKEEEGEKGRREQEERPWKHCLNCRLHESKSRFCFLTSHTACGTDSSALGQSRLGQIPARAPPGQSPGSPLPSPILPPSHGLLTAASGTCQSRPVLPLAPHVQVSAVCALVLSHRPGHHTQSCNTRAPLGLAAQHRATPSGPFAAVPLYALRARGPHLRVSFIDRSSFYYHFHLGLFLL